MVPEAITQMLTTGQSDILWFNANKDKLLKKYKGNFIAFKHKEVLDADTDLDTLLKKLNRKGIDTHNIFIEFLSKVKHIL